MSPFLPTLILRHRKENLKKCSLRGLETRGDCLFCTYPRDPLPDLSGYALLTLDAPVLGEEDGELGLFLIDGTWRYAEKMYQSLPQPHRFQKRSLPAHWTTAYPRKQTECSDPSRGLASVEALYAAYCVTGRDPKGLLDQYHWSEEFLIQNRDWTF